MSLSHDPLWPRAGGWPHTGDADVSILGVPTWRTSLSPTGAHSTPAAVREALQRYSPTVLSPNIVDLNEVLRIVDAGNVLEPDGDAGHIRVIDRIRELTGFIIALGGDNSATYPVAQAVNATGLITFDAHFDLREGISNGSPVRRLIEDAPEGSRIDPSHIVQIGIADFANSAAYARRARELGITVIPLPELRRRGIADVTAEALEVAGAGSDARIHLDVDIDVCDRSVAPGCPASTPGGLHAWELRELARSTATDSRVVSADLVEVDASVDSSDGRTVRLTALCVLELLSAVALRPELSTP